MLLADAESKEQVEQALAAGDDELANDIDYELERAKDQWERGNYCETTAVDYEDYIESDDFANAVIEASRREYDLSQIPRERVKEDLKDLLPNKPKVLGAPRHAYRWGPFRADGTGGNHFSYSITPQLDCWFPDSLLPDNAEFIPVDVAQDFWNQWPNMDWADTTAVGDNHGWAEGYEHVYITADYEEFEEWCRDVLATFFDQELRKDPTAGLTRFFNSLAPADAAFLRQADLEQDELLTLASSFLAGVGEEASDVRDRIAEYIEALKSPDTTTREIIDTWTQTDLVAMGIIKGTLFEEAPWRLIKLLPYDLRLEGTMMSHCVGDSSMGYIQAVKNGDIEIWSLRSRAGKPRFTLEVDGSFYLDTHKGRAISDIYRQPPDVLRAKAIKQLKGKGNRLAGFTDKYLTNFKFPEEVVFWYRVFTNMGVNVGLVEDLAPGIAAASVQRMVLRANPVLNFNTPYTPLTRAPRDPYRYW